MTQSILVPDLGFDTKEGTLANWLKVVGEPVQIGEPIAEIEADKVTMEVVASAAGILLQQLATVGQGLATGEPLALVGSAEEKSASPLPALASPKVKSAPLPIAKSTADSTAEISADLPSGQRISPVARRLAAENGIALDGVQGSGPGGFILKADVQAQLALPPTPVASVQLVALSLPTALPIQSNIALPQSVADPLAVAPSSLRRAIAQRMSKSKATIPHFYISKAILMDAALALRGQINAALPEGQKVTVNDLIVKAVALTFRDFPNLNASFVDEQIVYHQNINIGIAVAVEGGLMTVVHKNSDQATISNLAADNKARIERARAGKVKPDDISAATFTISNLGAYEIESCVPIINPPEAAILGVGTAKPTPVVEAGQIVIRTQMIVTISADHRLTDGVEAAQFLARLKEKLENPLRVVV